MSLALLIVDVQNDFCEGGSLAVNGGSTVAHEISVYLSQNPGYEVVVASKDFHNPGETNGGHFAIGEPDFASSWPPHCVANTRGSDFHPLLATDAIDAVVYKGEGVPAYSAFEGRESPGRPLETILREHGVTDVDVVGIATDYCVKATALDAVKRGFNVRVLIDLTAAVGGDEGKLAATKELADAGVWCRHSSEVRP